MNIVAHQLRQYNVAGARNTILPLLAECVYGNLKNTEQTDNSTHEKTTHEKKYCILKPKQE